MRPSSRLSPQPPGVHRGQPDGGGSSSGGNPGSGSSTCLCEEYRADALPRYRKAGHNPTGASSHTPHSPIAC